MKIRNSMVVAVPVMCLAALAGCYSFKGGSTPPHLNTVNIPAVEDVSGFFKATVREDLSRELVRRFRDDNSLRVIDDPNADSRLDVTITSIRNNERRNIGTNELETVRGVVVVAKASFIDNVKKREIFHDHTFQGDAQYDISRGDAGENEAIRKAIDILTEKILNETVAGW
jgi:hypothetical protein